MQFFTDAMNTFTDSYAFIVISALMACLVVAFIAVRIYKYETKEGGSGHSLTHIFIVIAAVIIATVAATQTKAKQDLAKAPAHKALDVHQSIVFKAEKGKTEDESDEIIEDFAYTLGLSPLTSDLAIDTNKPVTQEMVRFLQSNKHRNIAMMTKDNGKTVSQLVTIDNVIVKGDMTSGNPIKITKVAFRKPIEHYLNLLGNKVQFGNDPDVKGSVIITIESSSNNN